MVYLEELKKDLQKEEDLMLLMWLKEQNMIRGNKLVN